MRKLLLVLLLFVSLLKAQNTFTNSFHLDLTANQVQGDGYAGYNHIGFNVGFGTQFQVKKRHRLGFEINYAQRGSRQRINLKKQVINDFKLYLNYIDIPIFYVFPKWGIHFEVGPTISYLIYDLSETNGMKRTSLFDYRKIELGLLLSANFKITEQVYFKIRTLNSFTGIYNLPPENTGYFWEIGSFHRGVGLNFSYYFSKPKIGDSGTIEIE